MAIARDEMPWLPDFCTAPRVAAMLGLAELAVVVVALVPGAATEWGATRFLSASGYALWLALIVSGLLCVARRPLSALPQRVGAACAVALAALASAGCAAILYTLFAIVGDVARGLHFWRFVGGSAAVTTLIAALALRYFYVFDRWQAQVAAQARAEADALQARIRPHFLFNSMNMIAGLLPKHPDVAERAVLDLSDLFRAALDAGNRESTLAEEVELAQRYLDIEQLRLGERLRVDWEQVEPLPWRLSMPRLVLQPLLENAVLHGISRLPEGGVVACRLEAGGDTLRIAVRNPSLAPQPIDPMAGSGHAQRSIAHRLAYAFGPRARMVSGWDAGYYRCELELPLEPEPR